MFFPLKKQLMQQEEDPWATFPTYPVPLKTLIHPCDCWPQPPSELLLIQQKPNSNVTSSGTHLPAPLRLLLPFIYLFLTISIMTSTSSASFYLCFPLRKGGLPEDSVSPMPAGEPAKHVRASRPWHSPFAPPARSSFPWGPAGHAPQRAGLPESSWGRLL